MCITNFCRDKILTVRTTLQNTLGIQSSIIDSLDMLADKMEHVLQEQNDIEVLQHVRQCIRPLKRSTGGDPGNIWDYERSFTDCLRSAVDL